MTRCAGCSSVTVLPKSSVTVIAAALEALATINNKNGTSLKTLYMLLCPFCQRIV